MWIKWKRWKRKQKRPSTQKFSRTLVFISKFLRFSTNSKVKTKKKVFVPKVYEIRCESTKTTKKQFLLANFRAISINLGVLGLDLHSSRPEPVNFFGARSSLGGHKQSFGGVRPRNAPRGAGPALISTRGWFQRSGSSSFEFLLAEDDSVERSDHNVLQDTFCFQLSTVFQFYWYIPFTEVEYSRTHFEVLGLEASSPRKLPCSRLENSSIFGILKIL